MKRYLQTFVTTFFYTSLGFLLVAAVVHYKLNLTYSYAVIACGAIVFALFVAGGVRILRAARGNPVVNTILGFLLILPAIVVTRVIFSIAVFRFAFVIYVLAGIAAIAYAAAVITVSVRAKKHADDLNGLLRNASREKWE